MTSLATPPKSGDTLLTALAPAIWGTTYIVGSELLPPDRPFVAALLRVLPAGLLLVAFCRIRPPPGSWLRLILLATLNIGLFQALLFVAVFRLPGGVAAVIGAIQPMLVMALAWVCERRPPPRLAVVAGVAGVFGMAVLLLAPGSHWDRLGVAAALAGAASMAGGTYLARRWQRGLPVLAATGWQLLLGGLMLLPAALWLDPPLPVLAGRQMLGYAYLSIFGALLSYTLWFRGLTRLSPVAVSSLGLLSPVTAVLLGWVLLGQALHGLSLLGLAIVLVSVWLVQRAMSGERAGRLRDAIKLR